MSSTVSESPEHCGDKGSSPSSHELELDMSLQIPVLDMEDLRRSSSNRHCKLGSQLSTAKDELLKACKEWGTFHIVNHAIPMELIERYQALMMKIFSLPLEHKLKAKRSQFSVFGYEYRQNSGPLDIFQVGDQDAIIHYYARKFFPDSCPSEFSATIKECKEALCKLSIELLDIVIEGLGINPDDFDVYKRDMQAVLRANYYHRTDSQEQVIGLTPHMDGGFITLLLQDDVAGLEVMKDGEWFCVKPERNAICVHFGDMLEVFTNGHLKSVQHRSLAPTTKPRLSIGYFLIPLDTVVVSAASEFVDSKSNPPMFRPFKWLEYMELHRYLRSGLKGVFRPNPSSLLFFKAS
ncbi:hypothetical protein BDL97_13G007800 [Sphagnum fallax]|nr:hypothetical protein BDL97_13G007800 [Sphagnum fallax]